MNIFLRYIPLLIFISLRSPIYGQKNIAPNLVPNPSFEEYSDEPSGWYYSGKDFSRVAMYWTSPTAASPDIYGPKVRVPGSWQAAGFGNIKAHHGSSYAGITVYGCDQGKPHCREYVQVLLSEPLIPGQQYGFSCMLAHLPKSVAVKNIGLWFSEHEIDEGAHEPLIENTVLSLDRLIPSDGKWNRWTGQFEAAKTMSYLIIGNFKLDDDSDMKIPLHSDLRFGYYYLDDIRLYKIPPIIKPPASESPLKNYIPKAGESVMLSSIYFEHDRTDFMPRALIQLNELLAFLQKYPTLQIEIIGHTDNVGTPEYNQMLSIKRAGAVAWFLKKRGIDTKRLKSSGVGATVPVGSNHTSIGRSQNRRVEIKVLRL